MFISLHLQFINALLIKLSVVQIPATFAVEC